MSFAALRAAYTTRGGDYKLARQYEVLRAEVLEKLQRMGITDPPEDVVETEMERRYAEMEAKGLVYDIDKMTVGQLVNKKQDLLAESRKLLDRAEAEKRDLTTEEQELFDQLMRRVRRINDELEVRRLNGTDGPVHVGGWAGVRSDLPESRNGITLLRPEHRMADYVRRRGVFVPSGLTEQDLEQVDLGKLLRGLVTGNWKGADLERRAMGEGSNILGGYLLPEPLSTRIIDLARNQARVFQAGATTVPMETESLAMARIDKDPTAYWRAEHQAVTESDMEFGRLEFHARTLAAIVRLSVELVEDAQNVSQIVEQALSQALALELDRAALFGAGANSEPLGLEGWLRQYAPANIIDLGANGAALTDYAPFVRAVGKVLEANAPDTGLAAIYAPRTATELELLVDTTGQPLRPPAAFEALRKLPTNQVPTNRTKGTATNATVAFVGYFPELMVGMRTQVVLEASRTAGDAFGKLQVLVRAYLRADVGVGRVRWFAMLDGIIPPA